MPGKTFRIVTLGCKVNQYESAYLEEALTDSGWRRAGRNEAPDAVVVNTCMVTGRASYQSRQAIRKMIRGAPHAVVAATGCYAQVAPRELAAIQGVHIVAGNTRKAELPGLLLQAAPSRAPRTLREPFPAEAPFEVLPVRGHPGRTRALLKIQDGCDAYCSYCIVPYGRGHPRSMDVETVLAALRDFSRNGFRETVLTGIHLGRYGLDLSSDTNLKTLLRRFAREELPMRIRLSSLEPDEIDEELVDLVASEAGLCRHFHVAVQSGDNEVLERMNRPYRAQRVIDAVEAVRERIPEAGIGADLLVGFPGESGDAFERSWRLVETLPFTYLHVFRFSPRPGTPAAGFSGAVPHAEAKRRAAVLRELGRQKRRSFLETCLGKAFDVLVETDASTGAGVWSGLADNYVPFRVEGVEGVKPGDILRVRAERVAEDHMAGRVQRS